MVVCYGGNDHTIVASSCQIKIFVQSFSVLQTFKDNLKCHQEDACKLSDLKSP